MRWMVRTVIGLTAVLLILAAALQIARSVSTTVAQPASLTAAQTSTWIEQHSTPLPKVALPPVSWSYPDPQEVQRLSSDPRIVELLEIPRLGEQDAVYAASVAPDGTVQVPFTGVGLLQTPTPVLAAHSDHAGSDPRGTAFLWGTLRAGDQLRIVTRTGRTVYAVTSVITTPGEDVSSAYFDHVSDGLVMITCDLSLTRGADGLLHNGRRVVITTRRISP